MNFVPTVERQPLSVLPGDLEHSIRVDAVGDLLLLCEAVELDLHFSSPSVCLFSACVYYKA